MDIHTRKHLTGHWRKDRSEDFVTLDHNHECRFSLGGFAFEGKAKYERNNGGFIMEFPHHGERLLFVLSLNRDPLAFSSSDQASAVIGPTYIDPFERGIYYDTTLTKQPPSAPAP